MRRSLDTRDPGSEARRSRGARHAGAGVCRDARKVREAREPRWAVRKGRGVPVRSEGCARRKGRGCAVRGGGGTGAGVRGAQGPGCVTRRGRGRARAGMRGTQEPGCAVRRDRDARHAGTGVCPEGTRPRQGCSTGRCMRASASSQGTK